MIDAPGAAPLLPFWRVERILYDERGLLVVDKPTGLPVHGGDESLDHSVVARLGRHLKEQGRSTKLGVHQRLDQDTSGLLFFTTDGERNVEFSRAMESHQIARTYRGVVSLRDGRKPPEGRVRVFLRHAQGKSQVVAGASSAKSREAITHFSVVQRVRDRALLECRLETGRTHQIRATLAHLKTPLVGDRIYGGEPAPRLMLHARGLSGPPLPGEFVSPTPPSFSEALTGGEPEQGWLEERLRDACVLRAPLIDRTSALRLVNGEGDGIPGLTVDLYGAFSVINLYDQGLLPYLDSVSKVLASFGVAGVYLKKRVRADLREQDARRLAPDEPIWGERAPDCFLVQEQALSLNIELHDGLSTGLFVDMRDNRDKVVEWLGATTGREAPKMLNLFSYTCSFSVAAALAGAHTTSVDLSGKALARGRENFVANGLDPNEHRFFKEDAMKFLARSVRRGDTYDLIVLDPPSFSTVKKGTFSVKDRYAQAAVDCLRLLGPGGKLLGVTNHTKTSPSAFLRMLSDAAQSAGRKLKKAKALSAGLDCPDHGLGPWPSKSVLLEVE